MKRYTEEELSEIIKKHQNWLRSPKSGERADLTKADLLSTRWNDVEMRGAIFDGADFSGASLDGADFRSASVVGANLSAVSMIGAKLDKVDFSKSLLGYANLSKSSMRGANFFDVIAPKVSFLAVDAVGANFKNAMFKNAVFREASLWKSILMGADLSGVDFENASLRQANLSQADIANANFKNADIAGSHWGEAENWKNSHWDAAKNLATSGLPQELQGLRTLRNPHLQNILRVMIGNPPRTVYEQIRKNPQGFQDLLNRVVELYKKKRKK